MMIGGIPGPKRVGVGLEARAGLLRGAAIVGRIVGTTLGPGGRAVLIERRHAQPWISTDGYTIARHIDLPDRFEDMGGRLIRHVGSKVSDEVGDGSTTAMVLAAALMEEGHRATAAGADPMSVMRGMERGLAAASAALDAQSRPLPAKGGLERVARLASNGDDEIARHLADAIRHVGPDGVVTIDEAQGTETELSVHEGMSFDTGYVSPAFVTDPDDMTVMLEDAYVLMHEKTISSVDAIVPALRAFAKSSHTLLIVAEDVVGDALATLIVNKQQGGLRVAAVKAPGFGRWRKPMLEDIAIMTGGQIVTDELGNKLENLKPAMMGAAKRVHVARDRTTIVDGAGDRTEIEQRCNMLRREAEAEKYLSFDREKLQERLARLAAAIAHLRLGGATETELRARKERATDALNAARAAAAEGVVPGGGVALVQASRALGAVRRRQRRRGHGDLGPRSGAQGADAADRGERRRRGLLRHRPHAGAGQPALGFRRGRAALPRPPARRHRRPDAGGAHGAPHRGPRRRPRHRSRSRDRRHPAACRPRDPGAARIGPAGRAGRGLTPHSSPERRSARLCCPVGRKRTLPFALDARGRKLPLSHRRGVSEMTAIDPNKVHFTGENSFLRLRTEADGPETTVCAHWRTLISPAGPGTCLFLRSDATGDEVKLYADNIGMARWLQGELEAMLNPPFADTAMPIAEAAFSREGAFRETYREIVDSADGRIELSWSDMGEPFQLRLPPDNPDTGPWAVYSCLIPCRTATLEVAGTRAQGAAYENVMFEHPASSSCLAWSETWLRG